MVVKQGFIYFGGYKVRFYCSLREGWKNFRDQFSFLTFLLWLGPNNLGQKVLNLSHLWRHSQKTRNPKLKSSSSLQTTHQVHWGFE